MPGYEKITPPKGGKIKFENGQLKVPDNPIIPFIWGDGTGQDISPAAIKVFDAAVEKAYGGKRKVSWFKVYAGDEAIAHYYGAMTKEQIEALDPAEQRRLYMPDDTLQAVKDHLVAIKGPLTTPVGKGIRSLNVFLRQELDLYACVRPVRWFHGVPNPVKNPEKLNVIIFRENTEDVYAGIEYEQGTPEERKVWEFLTKEMKAVIREDSGIGIKPMSITGTTRIVKAAINYALKYGKTSVTIMHKGNIMKFTEGAFRKWGYEAAKTFGDKVITEEEVNAKFGGKVPEGKILIKDRIADSMFQQVLLRPEEYSIVVTPNLNGDYISDACAAQVGGLGIAPGANINYTNGIAMFEATHGTAPKYAGQDKVNPGSLILSGSMMFEYMGWTEVPKIIEEALERTIQAKTVTYDMERLITGAKLLSCSQFASAIVANMGKPPIRAVQGLAPAVKVAKDVAKGAIKVGKTVATKAIAKAKDKDFQAKAKGVAKKAGKVAMKGAKKVGKVAAKGAKKAGKAAARQIKKRVKK